MKLKIFALVVVVFAVLGGGVYYIFAGLEPKKTASNFNVSSSADNASNSGASSASNSSSSSGASTQNLSNSQNLRNSQNAQTATAPLEQSSNENLNEQNQSENSNQTAENTETAAQNATSNAESNETAAQNAQNSAQNSSQAALPKSLREDYEELLKGSKQDKSLGEPRYKVFLIGDFELSKVQRETIDEIIKTLVVRGGYAHYSLFVEQLDKGNLRLALFNEDLLDTPSFAELKGPLPLLWFKFNESSMQSIKNSFYIKDFKAQLPKDVRFRYMVLSGFTDDYGTEEYNYMLGLKRDAAVASEFMRQSAKIIFLSYGKDNPLAKQEAEEYRYKNRRVEAIINSY